MVLCLLLLLLLGSHWCLSTPQAALFAFASASRLGFLCVCLMLELLVFALEKSLLNLFWSQPRLLIATHYIHHRTLPGKLEVACLY